MEDDEDAILPPAQLSRRGSYDEAQSSLAQRKVNLHEVFKRPNWPLSGLHCKKTEARDLSDGKTLPSCRVPEQQFMTTVPVCMKEMKSHWWVKPLHHRVPTQCYTGLEIVNSEALGLTDPMVLEQFIISIPTTAILCKPGAGAPEQNGTFHCLHISEGLQVCRSVHIKTLMWSLSSQPIRLSYFRTWVLSWIMALRVQQFGSRSAS